MGHSAQLQRGYAHLRRRQSRCVLGFCSATAGTARSESRPCHPEHHTGPPLVTVLLLHGQCTPRVRRTVSNRYATGTPRLPEGGRSLRGGPGESSTVLGCQGL